MGNEQEYFKKGIGKVNIDESIELIIERKLLPLAEQIAELKEIIENEKPRYEKYFSAKQLAEILPYSPERIRQLYHESVFPGYQVEGRIFFKYSEIEKVLQEKGKPLQ